MLSETTRPGSTGNAAFDETQWSVILRAKGPTTPQAADALETLCRAYWYPLYAYVRRQGQDPASAQDLTQDFSAHLLENRGIETVERTKGRFRSFLLASLKNFMANARTRANALKRGGGYSFVSLNDQDAEARFSAEQSHQASPDKAFEQAWAVSVLHNVFSQLQTEYEA